MRPVNIPIRSLMPETDDALDYMPMPREMSTFEMPRVPEPGADADVAGARDVLAAFLQHFGQWLAQGGQAPALDVAGLAPPALRVLNETLGEGEVAAISSGTLAASPAAGRSDDVAASVDEIDKACSPASGANSTSTPAARCSTTTCLPRPSRRWSAGWPRTAAPPACATCRCPPAR